MTTKKKVNGDSHMSEDNVPTSESKKPTCFVIMPIADMPGYEQGHFGRVYEYLLKPAIRKAGYEPIRADDTSKTDYIVVGIIQKIVDSDMVICDLSGRNANVMYELGIRHAFNKPVALIKDAKTEKVFDIQGLRYTQYDETLRVDSVQKDATRIEQTIRDTSSSENKDLNSIVKLAGIHAAEAPSRTEISGDTQILLTAIQSIDGRLNKIEGVRLRSRRPGAVKLPDGSLLAEGDMITLKSVLIDAIVRDINVMDGLVVLEELGDGATHTYEMSRGFLADIERIPF